MKRPNKVILHRVEFHLLLGFNGKTSFNAHLNLQEATIKMDGTKHKLKNETNMDRSKEGNAKESTSQKDTDSLGEGEKEEVGDQGEVQLRKQSRSRLLSRNRKQPIPTTLIQTPTTNHQTPSSYGRSRSLTWYKTPSILPPQFSTNPFARKLSRQHRKWSAPITLSTSTSRRAKR